MKIDPDYGLDFPVANAFNFTWREVVDRGVGLVRITPRFWKHMELLQALRVWWDAPLTVTNGYRVPSHNARVGGAGDSQHLLFLDGVDDRFATDVIPSMKSPHANGLKSRMAAVVVLAQKARELGFTGIGRYKSFLHLDLRERSATWDG